MISEHVHGGCLAVVGNTPLPLFILGMKDKLAIFRFWLYVATQTSMTILVLVLVHDRGFPCQKIVLTAYSSVFVVYHPMFVLVCANLGQYLLKITMLEWIDEDGETILARRLKCCEEVY